MGEAKTVATDANVAEFLAAATPDRRRQDGVRLAEIFHEVTGADPVMWGPSIVGYGSFRYVSLPTREIAATGRRPGSRRERRSCRSTG